MKRLIAFMIIMALALPSFALAVEAAALPKAAVEGEVEVQANTYTLSIFGYTFIIISANKDVEEDSTTLAIINDGRGEVGELVANYRLGNTFGKMVSLMARATLRSLSERRAEEEEAEVEGDDEAVAPDNAEETELTNHGQIVSAFAAELIAARREAKLGGVIQTKDQLKLKIQDRVRDRIMLKLKIHGEVDIEEPASAEEEEEADEDDAVNLDLRPGKNLNSKAAPSAQGVATNDVTLGQERNEIRTRSRLKVGG